MSRSCPACVSPTLGSGPTTTDERAGTRSPARLSMIEAAERIVAERGLTAMSLRVVQQESGQRNKSAAQYHFGSRDGLIEAVLVTRMAAVNERRRAMLDAIAHPDPTRARPCARWSRHWCDPSRSRPCCDRRAAGHASWCRPATIPAVAEVVRRRVEGEAYRELVERLVAAMAGVPEPLRRLRVERAVGVVFASLAAGESGPRPGPRLIGRPGVPDRGPDRRHRRTARGPSVRRDPRRTRRPGTDAGPTACAVTPRRHPTASNPTASRPTASRPISRPSTAFPSTTRPSTPCLFWR